MNRRLDALLLERGRLLERISAQREAIRRESAPVSALLARVDSTVLGVRSVIDGVRRYPLVAALPVVALMVMRGRATLRWAGRAFTVWKLWRKVKSGMARVGLIPT
jgi:transposase InsO family protein